jgi:hypothetical protein
MTLLYFNILLLFIMFLVCSSCILDIALFDDGFMRMFLERLIQFSRELGGIYYVSVVLRYYLPVDAPYVLGHVVDREGDSFVESYIVHPPYIGYLVEPGLEREDSISNSP